MMKKKKQSVRLWLLMLIVVVAGTVVSGLYGKTSATEETYEGLQIFSDVIEMVEKNYVDPVDSKELIQKAIQGMVHSLDPHSQLLPPEAFQEFQIDTKGEFGGIGIVITMQKNVLTVISPIEGTPASKAGIRAGDIIIKVDGESTKDLMLWEAVKKMRGPKGTDVVITVVREDVKDPLDFNLTRDIIPIESVKYLALKSGYGYVRVTNFQDNTTEDLENALEDLEKTQTPLKGLILDLRDNPGGLLNQAIQVSDLFLDDGLIVSIKGRNVAHTREFRAHEDEKRHDYPMVVLINGGSASASEIVAGALQDHQRALILGTVSFGKGSVQTVETLRDGYGLKFTIARYYTPNGRSIQAAGIPPDIEVKYQTEEGEVIDDEKMLKEKDLKNHLQASPKDEVLSDEPDESDGMTDEEREKYRNRPTSNRYGPLKVEGLEKDNQVMRALEILIGYDILKTMKQPVPNPI